MTVLDRPLKGTEELDLDRYALPEQITPEREASPRRAGQKRSGKIGAGLVLIVVIAWLFSSFWVAVQVRSPRQPFTAPTAHQVWVRSPESGSRAFFRLRIPVYGALPQSVTLWLEGSQESTGFVNGYDLAPSPVAPIRLIDTAPDIPKTVQTVDIRPALVVGLNVVGVEVVSFNGKAPAFRARVQVRSGGLVQNYGMSPSDWRSTTNAALTSQQLPESGIFSRPRIDDGDWVSAIQSSSRPATDTVTVAPDSFTQPANAPGLIGSYGARSLVASTVVDFPDGCTEGWLRVGATGLYTVSLDGKAIASGTAGIKATTLPLSVFDLCPVARPGRHVLTIAVSASRQPVAYLDGMVRAGNQASSFSTGQGWRTGSNGLTGHAVAFISSPETTLGVLFARSVASITVPSGPLLIDHLVLTLELLFVALVALIVLCAFGVSLVAAVGSLLCGLLPGLGLLLILAETNHIVYVQSPFPNTSFTLKLVLGLALLGVIVTSVFTIRRAARERTAASTSPPMEPAGAGSGHPTDVVGLAVASPEAATVDPSAAMADLATAPSGEQPLPQAARVGWLRQHWYAAATVAFGGIWALAQSFHIMFNPLWQDELSSLAAAQGIRAHVLPQWPSGFLYWKSELYTALIAVVGGVVHDNPAVLREVSVLWFGATVVLFGLLVIPKVLPGRRVYQLGATIVFATAPFEMGHAQDIRMYQMLQCIVVVVAVLLLRAIEVPTTRRIAVLMVAVVAMYLTHEESFGVLVVIPLALICIDGLSWVRNWRWWAFGGAAVAAICVQLALALFTHPPSFGVDPSGGPLVSWSPQPFYYLANFFFANSSYGASITIVSFLAVLGIIMGVVRKDVLRLYLAAFWIVPMAMVSLVLATKDTRYVFLCLPFVFALASCGVVDIIDAVRKVVLREAPAGDRRMRRVFVEVFAALSMVAVMLSLIGGLNDYGTWTGSLFHANVSHRWLDYPTAVSYVKARIEPGDAVIAAGTPNLVGNSLGHAPNYWIPPHRTETLLYVFEKNGQAVDTQYGIPTIFNATDFQNALEDHQRVWLIGPDSAIRGLIPTMRRIVQQRFILQEDGEYVSVFLATNY